MSKPQDIPFKGRRKYYRLTPEPWAPIRVDINGEGFIEVVKAVDIGEGGIRVTIPHRFQGCHVDEPVSLIICLPDPVNKHFSVQGKIKHVANDSFGVRFLDLDDKARAQIRRYIGMGVRSRSIWDYIRYLLGMLR